MFVCFQQTNPRQVTAGSKSRPIDSTYIGCATAIKDDIINTKADNRPDGDH